jgi:hypothetical protein
MQVLASRADGPELVWRNFSDTFCCAELFAWAFAAELATATELDPKGVCQQSAWNSID